MESAAHNGEIETYQWTSNSDSAIDILKYVLEYV